MKFICKYIESQALNASLDPSDRSLPNVRRMFEAAGMARMSKNRRGDQLVWSTIIKKLRTKINNDQRIAAATT